MGEEKMKGSVKWFNPGKGFGFIVGEDGNDYFFHFTQMPTTDAGDQIELQDNDKVEFTTMETDKGTQAQNIELNN